MRKLAILGTCAAVLTASGFWLADLLAKEMPAARSDGARVAGSIRPSELLAEWRRMAGLPTAGALDARQQALGPCVRLRAAAPDGGHHPAAPVPLDAQGCFAIEAVPRGAWQLVVSWTRLLPDGVSVGDSVPAATVEVDSGPLTAIEVDLARLLPGEVEGEVTLDGEPLSHGQLRLIASEPGARSERSERVEMARTDERGRFRLRLRPGEYRVAAVVPRQQRWQTLRAPGSLVVASGSRAQGSFAIRTAALRVRLLDAGGVPAAGLGVELRDADGALRHSLPATGEDGWTGGEVEAEVFTASVLPRRLQDPAAQQAAMRAAPESTDPLAIARQPLGQIEVRAGAANVRELHLPDGWR